MVGAGLIGRPFLGHCGRWILYHLMTGLRRLADVFCRLHLNLIPQDTRILDPITVA
jgi:hypothetical protein